MNQEGSRFLITLWKKGEINNSHHDDAGVIYNFFLKYQGLETRVTYGAFLLVFEGSVDDTR